MDVLALAKGPAEAQFRRLGVEHVPWAPAFSGGRRWDLLLTGTSQVDPVELDSLDVARRAGTPSVALVDYWANYRCRFLRPDRSFVLPDQIVAIDDLCRQEMEADGLPPDRIHVLGQPYFGLLVESALPARRTKEPAARILFASDAEPETQPALAILLRVLASWSRPAEILLRFHPRETERRDRESLLAGAGVPWRIDEALDPLESARAVDVVVGASSSMLIECSLSGIPTAGFAARIPAFRHHRLVVSVNDVDELEAFLRSPLASRPSADFLAQQVGAATRVADLCASVAGRSST